MFRLIRTKKYETLLKYVADGCPGSPPHDVKVATIMAFARKSSYRFFVETGTYRGATAAAMSPLFEQVYTIELSDQLYSSAAKKLRRYRNIRALHGSSATLLSKIIKGLNGPAIFWLDAHHSGEETAGEGADPLHAELQILLEHKGQKHIVIIEDARGLGVSPAELRKLLDNFADTHSSTVFNDMVRIVPWEIVNQGNA